MTDIIKAAVRALADAKADRGRKYATLVPGLSRDEAQARAVLAAVTPLIEANALERAARLAATTDERGSILAAAIRELKKQP